MITKTEELQPTCTWSLSFHENNFYPAAVVPSHARSRRAGQRRERDREELQLHGQEEKEEERWRRDKSKGLLPFTGNREEPED